MGLFTDNRRERFSFTDDMVFHMIYGQGTEESKKALIALLNTVTGEDLTETPIKDINILNPIDYRKRENYKQVEFDIRLETDTGDLFDVEMEKQPDRYFKDRCVLYVMKLGDKALDKGEKYDKIRKTTMVAFVGGKLLDDEDIYHEIFGIIGEKSRKRLSGNLRFHLIEIDKVDQNRNVSDMTPLERVSLYFRYANDPDREALLELLIDSGDKAIILAENIFRRLTADDMEYEMLVAREKFEHQYNTDLSEARNEGLRQGEASGRAAERLEMAKAMRSENIDIETIIKISGLTREEIEKL